MNIIVKQEDDEGKVHADHPLGFATLCGWCDVLTDATNKPVDCESCLEIIRYCNKPSIRQKIRRNRRSVA